MLLWLMHIQLPDFTQRKCSMHDINIDQAWKVMAEIRFAMVTSLTQVGMRSRPLTAQVDTASHLINFIVSADSDICVQLQLIFVDLKSQNYISVAATGTVIQDSALAKRLWTPFAQAWFPKGSDDSEIRIVQASAKMIEYWAGESSKLVTAWELGKSLMTKTPPDLGEKLKIIV
jgi:general stress protein 26